MYVTNAQLAGGITEDKQFLTDLTTANVTIAAHGYTPKLPNDASKFLDGSGSWTVPPGTATGTVTSVSIVTANGVSGSVANPTTTPAITLTLGAITPSTVNGNTITTGTGTLTLATFTLTVAGTASVSGTNTGDQTNISGNAATVTVADAGGDATTWPLLGTSQTGSLSPATDAELTYNATTNALSTTTFIGALTGDVTGNVSGSSGSCTGNAATATLATLASTVTVIDSTSATCWVAIFDSQTGSLAIKTDGGLTYAATTGVLTATGFAGPLTGNVTGNVSGSSGSTTGNAATATLAATVTVIDSTDTTCWVAIFDDQTGSLAVKTDGGLTYNASTGVLAATGFSGPLTGNVTGNVTGSSGSTTGNAATATALQTTRAINGVDFDGTAPITVTAAASTLTGTTLNSTVVTSSLTSVGTLTNLVISSTSDNHLQLVYTGSALQYLTFIDSSRRWRFTKPTGAVGVSNASFNFSVIGGIDSITPFWSGFNFGGHASTDSGATNRFPTLAIFSRSTTATNPTDYEFVTAAANGGLLPIGVSFASPNITDSFMRFGFGDGTITTTGIRVDYNGTAATTTLSHAYVSSGFAINLTPTTSIVVPAGYGVVYPLRLTLTSGISYTLGSGSVMEII